MTDTNGTYLQQQSFEGQAGVPPGQGGMAEGLCGSKGQLQEAPVAIEGLMAAFEELNVGGQLLCCHATCQGETSLVNVPVR